MLNEAVFLFRYYKDAILHELEFPVGSIKNTDDISFSIVRESFGIATKISISASTSRSFLFESVILKLPYAYKSSDKIFCNGYQSWTDSREFKSDEELKPISSSLYELTSKSGDYTFFPYSGRPGELHGYTFTHIRTDSDSIQFFGSLNERCGYTIFKHLVNSNELQIIKDVKGVEFSGNILLFDLFYSGGDELAAYENYFKAWSLEKPKLESVTGWTSWYYHYTKISPQIIIDNLESYSSKNIPLDYFQVDDGYQLSTGDWINTNEKFPNGMKSIAESIHQKGIKAGLWLAPLICEKKSFIFREHKDWIVSPDGEHLLKAGYNPLWSGWYYALDFYNPDVVNYLQKVFDCVFNQWGFDMVKLDFLFAPALIPRRNKTRGQVMCEAIDLLRELCKGRIMLGCGVPLGPSFGKFEYCRIGNDIGLTWETNWMKKLRIRERVSTDSSLQNTISRHHLNGNVFLNDPDVFILRKRKNKLNSNQQFTLLVNNHLFGGLVFTSDNISEYDDETMELYKSVFPHRKKNILKVENNFPVYITRFSYLGFTYISLSNFSEKSVSYLINNFQFTEAGSEEITTNPQIELEAFQTKIFVLKNKEWPFFFNSSKHLFPGCEFDEFRYNQTDGLDFTVNAKSIKKGKFKLFFNKKTSLNVNGETFVTNEASNNVHSISFEY